MTVFTDTAAAIDEAVWLAGMTDQAHVIVRCEGGVAVMSYADAWFQRKEILETVHPTWEAA
ncbi:hypothetical protein [Salinicola peritrichatus]|uniref:hypothetical protein n=1 Tax=Salinicola peritrichatus TaxID=1267424 RepID=UPI000DA1EF20|nr:hypothetical protein [Salinicola peritrichatus]